MNVFLVPILLTVPLYLPYKYRIGEWTEPNISLLSVSLKQEDRYPWSDYLTHTTLRAKVIPSAEPLSSSSCEINWNR